MGRTACLAVALILSSAAPVWAQSPDLLDRAPAPVIAAGDVTADSAVLWVQAERAGTVVVELVAPEGSGEPPKRFQTEVSAASDFTAKIKIDGLDPDSVQRWRAAVLSTPEPRPDQVPSSPDVTLEPNSISSAAPLDAEIDADSDLAVGSVPDEAPNEATDEVVGEQAVGTFRTAPEDYTAAPVRVAWGADLGGQNVCRDAEKGFEIFGAIRDSMPDLFVGGGNMIYADDLCDAVGRYGNPQIPASFGKATDLNGFRAHWRYSRADPGLRRLLASTAYYAVWDDHEVLNDLGPLHDTRDEPPYRAGEHLLPLGLSAMLEQNPVGEDPLTPKRLYRSVRWGQHLELLLLDTRQYRDANSAPDSPGQPKTLLGREQLAWLKQRLADSDATWVVVASSVPLSVPTGFEPAGGGDGWANLDGQGGFESELRAILQHAATNGRHRLLFIGADARFGAAFRYQPFPERPEFIVHELVAGPLSAGVNGTSEFDLDLGAERLFQHAPASGDPVTNYADARKWFSFGELRIDAAGELTATLRGVDGDPLYTLRLTPKSATRIAGLVTTACSGARMLQHILECGEN
jgi:alkaline phosphatase D